MTPAKQAWKQREHEQAAYYALGMLSVLVECEWFPEHHKAQAREILALAAAKEAA